ncbi:MAG TPA: hypothetical protein VG123_06895 [Streptosporangiaceae bacterium]|nr:hypothetical protein [Streptosporangiaceae bacterium]HJY57516.1 hypothetical protein [Streptosporangiaceae bacterium]
MSAAGIGEVSHGTAGQDMPPGLASVRHLARHQIMGLVSVFLLGMAVNLTGLPSQTSGGAHLASIAFLAAHALIALGLIIGTVLLLRAAARLGGQWRRRAVAGTAAIAAAVTAGILTVLTSNWWSYIMAVGFITALLAYGSLLLPVTAPAHDSTPSSAPQV